jgi:hypothetical protein
MSFVDIFHNPIVQGAIQGVLAAAVVDFSAFRKWQSFHDAATYDWGTAAWRWFQGAVVGAAAAAGLGAAFGS